MDTIERGDIVTFALSGATTEGIVVILWDNLRLTEQPEAVIDYGGNYTKGDGVFARRAVVPIKDLRLVRKRGEAADAKAA